MYAPPAAEPPVISTMIGFDEPNSGAALTSSVVFVTAMEVVVNPCWVFTALFPEPQKLFPLEQEVQAVCTVVGPLLESKVGVTIADTAMAGVDLTTGEVVDITLTVADGRVVPAAYAPAEAIVKANNAEIRTRILSILSLEKIRILQSLPL